MTTIYLISNNITNKNFINDKNNDNLEFRIKKLSLNNEGINNAIKLSNYFKNINYIYSSEYKASIETSNYLSNKLKRKVRIDKRLNLKTIGITKLSELPNYYHEQAYLDSNYKLYNGESQNDVRNRMYSLINELINKYKNKNIILVTHYINIIYLLKIWCKIKYKEDIIYNNKVISKSTRNDPNIFKLIFNNNKIISIEYLSLD